MENKESSISYKKCALRREVACDVGCDFTLPDYLGDIKRIVMTRECVSVGGAYYDAGQITGCGVVIYNVVYIDSEGKLTSCEFTKDFECAAKCEAGRLAETYMTSRIVNSAVRATTPRKLAARSTVSSNLRGFCDDEILIPEEFEEGKLEFKNEVTALRSTFVTHLPEREYAERLAMLDGVMADDLTVISKTARPEIKSVENHDGVINVKGQIKLECAVLIAPLAPTVQSLTLEINEECPAGSKDPISISAFPNISSLTVSTQATEDGCEIMCDVILDLTVVEEENIAVGLPMDAYAPGRKADFEFSTATLESVIAPIFERQVFETRVDRAELGLKEAREIIITDATIKPDPITTEADRIVMSGEIKYAGVGTQICEDGSLNYLSFKNTAPYRYIVNNSSQNLDDVAYDVSASVDGVRCLFDKSEAVFECAVSFVGVALSDKTCSFISTVKIAEEDGEKHPRRVVVYYPDSDESLYEVAKRFDTTARTVANINSLGLDVASTPTQKGCLSGVKRLIIY